MKKIILLCSLLFISVFAFASMRAQDRGLTPLMNACRSGDLPLVKKLIKAGADVNASSTYYHRTALIYAVNGSINGASIVDYLIKNGAKLEITDTSFNTALLCCLSDYPRNYYGKNAKLIVNSRRKAAWLLLKAGAKIKVCNRRGLTPLLAASDWMGSDFIAELLKRGANIEARAEYSGNTPLINALGKNNIKVTKLLLKHGANPNAREYSDTAAIFFAKNQETVKLLIRQGAKLDCRRTTSSRWSENGFKILKSISVLENWARWADLKLIKLALKEHCSVTGKVLIAAARNYKNPEVLPLLLNHYKSKEKLPLDEIFKNTVNYDNIKLLLKKGANLNYVDNYGRTRLMYFAMSNKRGLEQYEIVKLLLKQGANPNIADKQGKTPLIWLMWRVGSVDIAKALITHGAKVDTKDKQGRTALLTLLANPYYRNTKTLPLLELLLEHKADLNEKDKNGASVLLLALGYQQLPSLIKYLIKLNVPVNTASKDGVTPLMLAARHYDVEIVKLLLERGAKVNASDDTGWTPLMYAAEYWPVSYGCAISPTPKCRSRKAPQETIKLLLQYGAKPDIVDKFGNTPLIEAARWMDADTLKQLIKHGKKDFVNARDERGRSALMRAMYNNYDNRVIEALLTAGAKCEIMMNQNKFNRRINFNIKDGLVSSKKIIHTSMNQINPPLFRAVLRGKKNIVKMMLEHGANPNWQYQIRKEERPIFPMAYCRDPEIATLLIKAGAKGKTKKINPAYSINTQKFIKACETENIKKVEKIFKLFNPQDKKNQQQLLYSGFNEALRSNNLKVVKWLLAKGARLSKDSIMNVIANAEHPNVLRYLLKHSLNTEYRNGYWYLNRPSGKSAIYFASSAEIVNILVKNGMNVNERNKRRKRSFTPLQYAFRRKWKYTNIWRRPEVVEALIKNGANLKENNKRGNVLFWAFHVRYMGPDIKSIKMLLKYGADVNTKNSKGETLLNLSVRKRNCYLTDILLTAGADPSLVKKEDIKKTRPYISWRINKALLKQKEKNSAAK